MTKKEALKKIEELKKFIEKQGGKSLHNTYQVAKVNIDNMFRFDLDDDYGWVGPSLSQNNNELYNTYEKAKQNADIVWCHTNGDHSWKKDGVWHLMRDGVEIASGDWVGSYINGDYMWQKDGVQHLMRDGVEIASGDYADSYDNGDYRWRKDGVVHYCRIIDGYVWERIKKI